MKPLLTLILTSTFLLLSCGPDPSTSEGSVDRQAYLGALAAAGLLDNEEVQQWRENGRRALRSPEELTLPGEAAWTVSEEDSGVRVFAVTAGERGRVSIRFGLEGEGFLLLDLFEAERSGQEEILSTNGGAASFTARGGRTYLLRLQPEIYATGEASLRVDPVE